MSTWSLVLISIGVVSIVVSLARRRHSAGDDLLIAVHQRMTDDRIAENIRHRRMRMDAKLGIQYGLAFIAMGVAWQLIIFLFWF
ncbi:hypothetical protein LOC67_27180 [Stieleria sp. JC731]|uniref:hypothetical protein n=1 Tax=Stieleria sp. JC731 TaxID=2894195 RepID=UPI001E4CAD07|nr:hypothetical protein [Stieleria sp. JC731]MCC9604254.1 hypothetical protein [Stieleria sp. JC731]